MDGARGEGAQKVTYTLINGSKYIKKQSEAAHENWTKTRCA